MNVTLVYSANNKHIEIADDELIGVEVWDGAQIIKATYATHSDKVSPTLEASPNHALCIKYKEENGSNERSHSS
jgi:hypothetical protein